MSCYKKGGCGVYEMYSCSECPASKPNYLTRYDKPAQALCAVVNEIADSELVSELRLYGSTHKNGRMGTECVTPKWLLNLAADRIESLKGGGHFG